MSRGARKRRREGDDAGQEGRAREDGAGAGGKGSAPASRTVLEPPRPAEGELGLEEASLVSINSCPSPVSSVKSVSVNSSRDSLDSQVSTKLKNFPPQSIAVQEYLSKSTELRKMLATNSEELRIINEVETFLPYPYA
jgi:hypothetical protein